MRKTQNKKQLQPSKKKNRRWILYAFIALIILGIYSRLETYWLKVNHVTIQSPDIPPAFDGKKIVFVSDIHHGKYLSIHQVNRVVELINEQHPDMILLGGDYSYNNSSFIRPVFEALEKAKAPIGKFAVMGNHDYFVNPDLTRKMIHETGIYSCDNLSYWIKLHGDSIKVGGVGETQDEEQLLENTVHDVKKKDFCILMCHQPSYVEMLNNDKVDLTLSGHTHGGQVTFFGLWAPILPTPNGLLSFPNSEYQHYRYGLVKKGKMQSYISSGVGVRFPPVRFFCRPEIAVIELKREVKSKTK